MGSFDMACGMSGLSLGGQQPTKMFFIIENQYKDGFQCYSTDLFKFCSFGIDMVYDDYGQYDCDENQPAYQEFLRFIKERAVYVPQGGNQFHEKEFNPENPEHLEYEYLMEQIDKHRVRIKTMGNGCWHELPVSKFPIHKRVFDEYLQSPLDDIFDNKITVDNCCDMHKTAAIEHDFSTPHLREIVTEQFENGEIDQETYDEKMSKLVDRVLVSGSAINSNVYFYGQYNLTEAYSELGEEQFWSLFSQVYMLHLWSMNLNKMITPVMSGGQEYGFEEKIGFYDGVSKIANEIKSEWESE